MQWEAGVIRLDEEPGGSSDSLRAEQRALYATGHQALQRPMKMVSV